MYKDSVYKKIYESNDELKNRGYDYASEGMAQHFFSDRMYMNPVMNGFLVYMNRFFVEFTDSVKKIQFYTNYTNDKNDGSLNQ
jgi:hypothetical protein